MAITATEDATSTHPTESNDTPRGRPGEVGTPADDVPPLPARLVPEPLESAVLDPYDNIACTD